MAADIKSPFLYGLFILISDQIQGGYKASVPEINQ